MAVDNQPVGCLLVFDKLRRAPYGCTTTPWARLVFGCGHCWVDQLCRRWIFLVQSSIHTYDHSIVRSFEDNILMWKNVALSREHMRNSLYLISSRADPWWGLSKSSNERSQLRVLKAAVEWSSSTGVRNRCTLNYRSLVEHHGIIGDRRQSFLILILGCYFEDM